MLRASAARCRVSRMGYYVSRLGFGVVVINTTSSLSDFSKAMYLYHMAYGNLSQVPISKNLINILWSSLRLLLLNPFRSRAAGTLKTRTRDNVWTLA